MRLWVSRVAKGMNKDLEFVVTPVSGAIGADVSGIDVSGSLDQKIPHTGLTGSIDTTHRAHWIN